MWSGFGATLSSQDPPCHLMGAKDHARNVSPLPPHSHPEQNEEWLKRNVGAGLWSGVSLLPVCLENMCCQIAERIKRSLFFLSEAGSGLRGGGFPPAGR